MVGPGKSPAMTTRKPSGARPTPLQEPAGQERGRTRCTRNSADNTSGRLVEECQKAGGEETCSNPWLPELQQDMFIEDPPRSRARRAFAMARAGSSQQPTGASRSWPASGTERVGPDTVFCLPPRPPAVGRRHALYFPNGRRAHRARRGLSTL
jgi:hypothetical protein